MRTAPLADTDVRKVVVVSVRVSPLDPTKMGPFSATAYQSLTERAYQAGRAEKFRPEALGLSGMGISKRVVKQESQITYE